MPVRRSSWMLGTATFPAVMSRSAIPSPLLVAIKVHMGRRSMLHGCTPLSGDAGGRMRPDHAKMHSMPDWDDIRVFLEVQRSGTLAGAARKLGVDYTTVGRRLRAMERDLGTTLFERKADRFILTEAGEEIRVAGEQMEEAALALERRALGADRSLSGLLRVATTDALAQLLVLPALGTLRERHPDIRVQLLTGPARLDIARREADVAVRYVRPEGGDLISRRLLRIAAAYYGSTGYLAKRPVPPPGTSMRGHDVVAVDEGLLR